MTETTDRCVACGEPAARWDVDGVPLCEGDFQHLLEHWTLDPDLQEQPDA